MPLTYIKNNEGQYVCQVCGETKQNQNTMHYHIKKHTNDSKYTCKFCKKTFVHQQSLNVHMQNRHSDQASVKIEAKEYVCPFEDCTFRSPSKGNCKIHCLRIHYQDEVNRIMTNTVSPSGQKTIGCNVCRQTFNSPTAFYYHCADCIKLVPGSEKYMAMQWFNSK
jgi:uncharacterized Zn-finger protein